jgi:hypothetical protein
MQNNLEFLKEKNVAKTLTEQNISLEHNPIFYQGNELCSNNSNQDQ